MKIDKIETNLSFYCNGNIRAIVTMKSKKFEKFTAFVQALLFDEDDVKVRFIKSEENLYFPGEDGSKEFITYIKNIKEVSYIEEDFINAVMNH